MSGIVKPFFGSQLNLDHPLSRGLVGSWIFNEGSGIYANDSSGQNNVGTLVGMNDPPIATSGWNAGPHGGALAFDGVNDYVDTGLLLVPVYKITNQMSVSFWAISRITQAHSPLGNNDGAPDQCSIDVFDNNGSFWARVRTTADATVSGGIWTAGILYNIVIIYDGISVAIYVNGKFINSTPQTGNVYSGTGKLLFGKRGLGAYPYAGAISSVSIYNRALSAEEIAYLYAFPYCMFDTPPIWQSFDPYRAQRAMNHNRQMRAA